MIPDWETTLLFVSDRLENEFPALLSSLRTSLETADALGKERVGS